MLLWRRAVCILGSIFLLLVLGGCATPTYLSFAEPAEFPKSSTFVFSDDRQEAGKNLSQSNAATTTYFSDVQLVPSPPALVERALRRANESLNGIKIQLKEFSVSLTRTPVQRSPMADFNAHMYGAFGALMTSMLDASRSPDHGSANVELYVNGASVRAGASGSVSKYNSENGMLEIVNQMLDKMVDAVLTRSMRQSDDEKLNSVPADERSAEDAQAR